MKVLPTTYRLWFSGFATALVATCYFCSLVFAQDEATGIVIRSANLRAGPATTYPVVGGATAGQEIEIVATNAAATWLQLENGRWIAAFLVDLTGDNVPAPAPTPTAGTGSTALRTGDNRLLCPVLGLDRHPIQPIAICINYIDPQGTTITTVD